jgi:hypothetical protein
VWDIVDDVDVYVGENLANIFFDTNIIKSK